MREALAYEVDGPSYVDVHDKIEVVKAEGISLAIENLKVELLSESIFNEV